MIPRIIHYCWFGGKPLPDSAKKCINSWKKFLPSYQIKEWNELNFDINSCAYCKEAYEKKRYAFVSDYVRFKVLNNEGGLYFDTDVEIIKSIDDIIANGPFMAMEDDNSIASGLGMGAEAHMDSLNIIVQEYEKFHFINQNGDENLKTVVDIITGILIGNNETKMLGIFNAGGFSIYPREYFCPMNPVTKALNITNSTRAIHHYDASWHNEKEKKWSELEMKMIKSGISVSSLKKNYVWRFVGSVYKYGIGATIRKFKRCMKE